MKNVTLVVVIKNKLIMYVIWTEYSNVFILWLVIFINKKKQNGYAYTNA